MQVERTNVTNREHSRKPLALYALTAGAFAIGMTEFVIMGLLPNVASDLHVSIPKAGLLITGYALGVAIGAPILTLSTRTMPRKLLLMGLMILFILGNALSAMAPDYNTLMMGRILASLTHGAFFGVGAVVASNLVPVEKRASAIALMFTGLTIANILGVPLGTFLGQQYGWRSTFWLITICGVLSFIGVAWLVPKVNADSTSLAQEVGVLKRPRVLVALLMTVFGFGGVFTAFTYIAPILEQITGFSQGAVSLILVLFGAGVTIGNILGGKLADWRLMPALTGILAVLAIVLALFSVTDQNKVLAVITVFIWGAAAFGIVPGLQLRTVNTAKGAPTLASALNIAAFNLGNAGGAYLGGLVINTPIGLPAVPWVAAIVTLVGLLFTLWGSLLDRASTKQNGVS